jgi:hypothetical protein
MRFRLSKYFNTAFLTIVVLTCAPWFLSETKAQLFKYETERLRLVYYGKAFAYVVPYVARCYENALSYHTEFFDYKPTDKVTLFLHDFSDYNNAGASTAPFNKISLAIAPASYVFETTPANERVNATLNHEVVHLVASDKPSGSDGFFRSIFFGKVYETNENALTILYSYLTSPRRSASRWYHEGIAVFMETWMAGGLGRAQGPWDEMVFRTKVRDSSRIYDLVGLESEASKVDFQVGVNAYLYGTRFMSYLAHEYGPEKLIEWVNRKPGSRGYFIGQFKKVYGISMEDAWGNWIKWEFDYQNRNLDSVRVYPITTARPLSGKALGSVSQMFFDEELNELILAVNFPGEIPYIGAINLETGQIRKICGIKGPALYFVTSLAYNKRKKTLFYTTDNNDWRDICEVNVITGKQKMHQKDTRIGDLSFCEADSSLWGVRHSFGISTIVRIPYPYDKWNMIYALPYGKDVYDVDISSDGRRLSAGLAEISGRQTLISFPVDSLINGSTYADTLFDFGNSIAANFIYSDSGNYLYGSSYYTGVSNIFRYDFERDSMEALSNCETGFFRPFPYRNDSVIIIEYTGEGFVPSVIAEQVLEDINPIRYLGNVLTEKYPQLRDWILSPPSSVDLDTLKIDTTAYHSFWHMKLANAYPIVEGYGDYVAWGGRLNFQSPEGLQETNISVSYTPQKALREDERFHINWTYSYGSWELGASHNAADFYDLFGPTKSSRRGNSARISYTKSLVYDSPKSMNLVFSLTGYNNLEVLPEYQNVSTSSDKFAVGKISWKYSNLQASLGAVDYEKGITFQMVSTNTFVSKSFFPKVHSTFDFGFPLPIKHSSLWLRSAAGAADGDRFEPFANFFFGGFGNNYVDFQHEKQYRHYYSFPGVELNELGGRSFVKSTLEWSLPPLRFRHLGTPTLYATWARLALFTSALYTNPDNAQYDSRVGNLGAQIDFRLTFLSHLNLTISSGYARAFEKGFKPSDEFMFSVKLL